MKVDMCYLSACITTINSDDCNVNVSHKNYSPITKSV